jgi:hypothetical protein
MKYLQARVLQSHGMAKSGSLEEMEQIGLRIRLMESDGLRQLLETRVSQPTAMQSRGMEHDGSLEVKEQVSSRIHPME